MSKQLYRYTVPGRGILKCHGAILGNEGLSREVRLLDILESPLIRTCLMTELFGGGDGKCVCWGWRGLLDNLYGLFQLHDLTKCHFLNHSFFSSSVVLESE